MSLYFRILAGLPPTTAQGGTSFVTTAPIPITAPSLIVTPGIITAFAPIHTLSFIVTGFLISMSSYGSFSGFS